MTPESLEIQKGSGESGLRLVSETLDRSETDEIETQFVNFLFLRVNPDWRRIDRKSKLRFRTEFLKAYADFDGEFLLFSYSLVGLDSKADLMFWRIGRSLDMVQEMTAQLFRTGLGGYLETVDSYLAVTKQMMFVDGPSDDRRRVHAGVAKYHFVYPCPKSVDWGDLSSEERDSRITERFMVGKRFPNIRIHLTHAFGFNDHEYLISFETDEPRDFISLTEEFRQSNFGQMAMRGMPIYTCRQRSLADCLDALG